ncbi:glucose-6-phosphate dehydrogenase [Paremcibacter congregatus]|uniref:glucose-6-phosphate dehydrogenase n=1 Tax=Paremcibacter congregatus TaxID=2043170 RepID=UPI0030EB6D06|tara:strand:- start:1630 stop:3039 length:1410 start_codon:yes stop_codon:yes gene_type:complete
MRQLDVILFGGSGDLATRKLIPALAHIMQNSDLLDHSRLLIAAQDVRDDQEFRTAFAARIAPHLSETTPEQLDRLMRRMDVLSLDLRAEDGWRSLSDWLSPANDRDIIYYFAVPSFLFASLCRKIRQHNLNPPQSRIVVEKPLGEDLTSAAEINGVISETFAETQIFRIDHYLGKTALQNILPLRIQNPGLEALWHVDSIDNIQITLAETVGVEGRTELLDRIGTLKDMVQNHMLQIVALLTMDLPQNLTASQIRRGKIEVLQSLRPITEDSILSNMVIGQYRAGTLGGQTVPGYQEEISASAGTGEMFVALRIFIDTDRWAGVPVYLRTGKRLRQRCGEIVITFKPRSASPDANERPRRLMIEIHPDQNILSDLPLTLHNPLAEGENTRVQDAYEKLLQDVIQNDQTFFVHWDEIEASWRWIDQISHARQKVNIPMQSYAPGTSGPISSHLLPRQDGKYWYSNRVDKE